ISRQIDYLGKMPVVTPKPVRTSKKPKDMLRYDLDNENETIRNYRDRIRQCEALGEYAMAEQIRQILMQEQDHQIDLATPLGIKVPAVSSSRKRRTLSRRRGGHAGTSESSSSARSVAELNYCLSCSCARAGPAVAPNERGRADTILHDSEGGRSRSPM